MNLSNNNKCYIHKLTNELSLNVYISYQLKLKIIVHNITKYSKKAYYRNSAY